MVCAVPAVPCNLIALAILPSADTSTPPALASRLIALAVLPADERTRLAACAPVCAMVKLSPAPFAA